MRCCQTQSLLGYKEQKEITWVQARKFKGSVVESCDLKRDSTSSQGIVKTGKVLPPVEKTRARLILHQSPCLKTRNRKIPPQQCMERPLSALFFAGRSPGGNYCENLWCILASIQAHVYGKSKISAINKVGTKAGQVLNKPGGRLGGEFGWQTKVAYAVFFKAYAQKQRDIQTHLWKRHSEKTLCIG